MAIRLIERKESFYVRKRFISHRIGLGHQHGYLFIKQLVFRYPKVAEMTSCENALLAIFSMRGRLDRCSVELHYGNVVRKKLWSSFLCNLVITNKNTSKEITSPKQSQRVIHHISRFDKDRVNPCSSSNFRNKICICRSIS